MNAKALLGAVAASFLIVAAGQAQTDPLAGLATAVTVVMADSLMLRENDHGVANTRTLKIGETYRDGWTLTAVSPGSATLKKGAQTRVVNFTPKTAPAPQAAEQLAAGPGGAVALTNSVAGTRIKRPAQPADRAKIQAAITAGDVSQVYALGGTANDIAAMLAAQGGPMARLLSQGGEANFVNIGGRTGISVDASNGGNAMRAVTAPPELANVEPPAEAPVLAPPTAGGPGTTVSTDGNGATTIRQTIVRP